MTAPHIVRCQQCGLIALWPQPSDTILEASYTHPYYDPHGDSLVASLYNRLFRVWSLKRLRLLQHIKPTGRFLDVGCGAGQLVQDMLARGYDAYGTDTSVSLAEVLPEQIRSRVTLKDLSDCEYPAQLFDLIMLSDVLEHVRQPRQFLQTIHRLLKNNGCLVVSVPNWHDPEARVFGRRYWHNLDAPRHLWHFTPATLERLVQRSGFTIDNQFSLGMITLLEAPLSLVHGWQRWLSSVKTPLTMQPALFIMGAPFWLITTPIIRLFNSHRPRQLRVILKKSNLSSPSRNFS